jgi:hypothetical protein
MSLITEAEANCVVIEEVKRHRLKERASMEASRDFMQVCRAATKPTFVQISTTDSSKETRYLQDHMVEKCFLAIEKRQQPLLDEHDIMQQVMYIYICITNKSLWR